MHAPHSHFVVTVYCGIFTTFGAFQKTTSCKPNLKDIAVKLSE